MIDRDRFAVEQKHRRSRPRSRDRACDRSSSVFRAAARGSSIATLALRRTLPATTEVRSRAGIAMAANPWVTAGHPSKYAASAITYMLDRSASSWRGGELAGVRNTSGSTITTAGRWKAMPHRDLCRATAADAGLPRSTASIIARRSDKNLHAGQVPRMNVAVGRIPAEVFNHAAAERTTTVSRLKPSASIASVSPPQVSRVFAASPAGIV